MTRIVRRAARLSVVVSTVALSVALGATAATAEDEPSPTPTAEPTPTVIAEPTVTAEPGPEPSATATPTAQPTATSTPSPEPSKTPDVGRADPTNTGTITGRIWNDVNKNGIQEAGERGFASKSISASEYDSAVKGARAAAVRKLHAAQRPGGGDTPEGYHSTETDRDGNYVLRGVKAGTVVLEFGAWGWIDEGDREMLHTRISPKNVGDDRAKDSDFDESEIKIHGKLSQYDGVINDLVLPAGQTVDRDGGMFADPKWVTSKTITVEGRVWNDRNRNGIQETGEPGVADIPVVAISSNVVLPDGRLRKAFKAKPDVNGFAAPDPDSQQAVTNADGTYVFKGLGEGAVQFAVASGPIGADDTPALVWSFSPKGAGTDRGKDSDVAAPDGPTPNLAYSDELRAKPNATIVFDAGLFRNEPTPSPTTSTSPGTGGGGGSLPNTGLAIGGFLIAGVGLIGGGTALTIVARRRRGVAA